jgi:hypothetical protein
MPPVDKGKGWWIVEVSVLRVVKVMWNVELTVVVGEAAVIGGIGERVIVVIPIVTLETGV